MSPIFRVSTTTLIALLISCSSDPEETDTGSRRDAFVEDVSGSADAGADGGTFDATMQDSGLPDADGLDGNDPDSGSPDACGLGEACNPIPITTFPFVDQRDTSASTSRLIDSYDCAPTTNESGPEIFYRVTVPSAGLLNVSVDDLNGDDVDIDIHLLEQLTLDGTTCLARANISFSQLIDAGTYYLVADTWVDGNVELAGPYTLNLDHVTLTQGDCATQPVPLKMYWSSCAPNTSFDCDEAVDPNDGQTYRYLQTPAVGPVVLEAHLVTVSDSFGGGWPSSFTDQIEAHYALSETATGYVMQRNQPWAPAGEGGSQYGQGSTGAPIPVIEEAFYITMYWRDRPSQGTRMIVRNPATGRAVVAAAGFETGPGSNEAIAGVTEEIHHHLGTGHRDDLLVGFAQDQTLPFGPIQCP